MTGVRQRVSCCISMKMSPFVLDRKVPLIRPPRGGQIQADRDEREGTEESGGASTGVQQAVAAGRRRPVDARELPAGEAPVEALSGGRRNGSEAPQRGAPIEPRSRGEISRKGAAVGAEEVQRANRGAFWAHAGGGTLGFRGWDEDRCRNTAPLDAGGGVVESGAKAAATSAKGASAKSTLAADAQVSCHFFGCQLADRA